MIQSRETLSKPCPKPNYYTEIQQCLVSQVQSPTKRESCVNREPLWGSVPEGLAAPHTQRPESSCPSAEALKLTMEIISMYFCL